MEGWISQRDRRLVRRWLLTLAIAFAGVAFFVHTGRFYARKFYASTGRAEWIWAEHRLSSRTPVVFFAAKTFDLPPRRNFVRINVACDPEYTLFFNGREVGGGRFEERKSIDVYDVTPIARERGNRIVIAARSAHGVGGLLASVDFADDVRNAVVTSKDWTLYAEWSPRLGLRDLPLPTMPLAVIGQPPIGRWDYLPRERRDVAGQSWQLREPVTVERLRVKLPKVEVKSGVAVTAYETVDATAFDFGHVEARARIIRDDARSHEAVRIRYANAPEELAGEGMVESVAFARGERSVTEPAARRFRYIIVYGSDARASVLEKASP